MYIHFQKTSPFHKRQYLFTDKKGVEIGKGKLENFSREIASFKGAVEKYQLSVDIINAPEKNKPMGVPGLSGRKVATFSFADGQQGDIQWMFKETGKKALFGIKKKYYWWNVTVNGSVYQMYRVGFGKEGYFFQFNQNDCAVAMISKEIVVKDFCDEYELYIEDEQSAQAVLAAVAYIDLCFHHRYFERAAHGVETHTEKTDIPEIVEKFDHGFIPRMRKQEGM